MEEQKIPIVNEADALAAFEKADPTREGEGYAVYISFMREYHIRTLDGDITIGRCLPDGTVIIY